MTSTTTMTTPHDDPVIAAVARARGGGITLPAHSGQVTLSGGGGGRDPTTIVFIAGGTRTGNEHGKGYACVVFTIGHDLVHYYNDDARQDVRVPSAFLPDTAACGAIGRRLAEVVDIPGIGDRTIADVEMEQVFGRWKLVLAPGAGRKDEAGARRGV